MTEQEQYLKMVELYQALLDGKKLDYLNIDGEWVDRPNSTPSIEVIDCWRIRPELKPVDLSVLIKSGIDCEFWGTNYHTPLIGKLTDIDNLNTRYCKDNSDKGYWDRCQPRLNHWHNWQGDDCPLPDGFMVQVIYRDGDRDTLESSRLHWTHYSSVEDIIAFKVLRLTEGYCYPWEKK